VQRIKGHLKVSFPNPSTTKRSVIGHVWLAGVEFSAINDIGTCKDTCDLESISSDIIAAYQQIILGAHSQNIRVYGATITPFGGFSYATLDTERARQAVNRWIRIRGHFDAVIDFDAVLRDANNWPNLSPISDSGDHLHPTDIGYKAMADSIDPNLFDERRTPTLPSCRD